MVEYKLDEEEQEILNAFESGKLKSVPNVKDEIEKHRQIAAATFKKDKRINIRIANRDLSELQKLALAEGIPYQTFITSILHKFADGKYIEKQH
ncbi:antitoxin [Methyloprofundus sedimenti]|uniref:Antitoxin n=1 Tax=Methyloprofundus sedimenti TaxID=1420851 RepID=A0A1V8M8D5_9GAMM|nr:antitoxin [Methyloprofundus sedimenti]OQK17782.1 antitoxin [Methyloprofundus sedimenti]